MVNSRTEKGVGQYRVRWAGYTEFEDKWETIDLTDNGTEKLKELWQKFFRKTRDEREV